MQKVINCICLKKEISSSIIFSLKMQSAELGLDKPYWVGWEKNNGKLNPRIADMSKIMDPLL